MPDFNLLLFHSAGLEILAIPLLLLDLVIVPCIFGIAFYRILTGRVTDLIFYKSLLAIGILGIVSFLAYCAFVSFVVTFISEIQPLYFLYCLSFPFGLVWAVGATLYLDSTIIGIFFGFFVNLMSMIGVVSFWENRRLRKAGFVSGHSNLR